MAVYLYVFLMPVKPKPQSSRTCSVYNKAQLTTDSASTCTNNISYSDEDINNFYNDVDETLAKPNHYTIVMRDFNVINQVNIGSDHRLVMSNIKLDVEVEKKQLMTKRPPRVDATRIGSKKIEFHLELRNRFETLQELDETPRAKPSQT